jgi:hypothetical protein
VPSVAFAKSTQARLPLFPALAGAFTTLQVSLSLRTGHLLHPASTPASQPKPGASLPGTLASPRTGLSPAGCRELALGYVMSAPLRSWRPSCWTHVDRGLVGDDEGHDEDAVDVRAAAVEVVAHAPKEQFVRPVGQGPCVNGQASVELAGA